VFIRGAVDAGVGDLPDQRRHVVVLCVAVLGTDVRDAVTLVSELIDLEPVRGPYTRSREVLDCEDDRVLGQGVEVVDARACAARGLHPAGCTASTQSRVCGQIALARLGE
jgi:hypothetical protein